MLMKFYKAEKANEGEKNLDRGEMEPNGCLKGLDFDLSYVQRKIKRT